MNPVLPSNRLLDALDPSSRADLLANSRCVDWHLGETVAEPGQFASHRIPRSAASPR